MVTALVVLLIVGVGIQNAMLAAVALWMARKPARK